MKIELRNRIERTLERSDNSVPGRLLVKQISHIIDSAIHSLFGILELDPEVKTRFCLIATGGYGRMELAPFSDIDLLYLHDGLENDILEKIISQINNSLFDSGMDVGHSCRTIEESKFYIENIQTFHSILDSRYLLGSRSLFEKYQQEFLYKLPMDLIQEFNSIKIKNLENTLFRSHTPLLLTEPNIKNGPLGLRDIQYLYWLEKASDLQMDKTPNGIIEFFTRGETLPLIQAYDFLLKTRVSIHKVSKKKNDRLDLSLQTDIAVDMGYGERSLSSVENFMADFYKYQKEILHYVGLFLDEKTHQTRKEEFEEIEYLGLPLARSGHYLFPSNISKPFTLPENLYQDILTVFLAAQSRSLFLSATLLEQIKFAGNFLDDDFKHNRISVELFMQLIRENISVGLYLTYMHRTNILGKLIPEFRACTNFPLFSYHHEYPVDEHSLLILRELDNLVQGQFPDREVQEVFQECENIHVLYLALLIHDAGKVKDGDHCQYGAELSVAVSRRLNLTEEEADLFQFLVARHIDMSEISSKRDIFDPELIQEFAETVHSKDRLKLLYVLTIIDTKSVGPMILTNWKKDILYKLYRSTLSYLESNSSTQEKRKNTLQHLTTYLIGKEGMDPFIAKIIADFADKIQPTSYLNSTTYRRVLFHFTEFQKLKKHELDYKIEFEKEPSCLTLSVYSRFRKDILLHIAGSVSSLNLNLIGMQPFRYKDNKDDLLITQVEITDSLGSGNINDPTLDLLESELDSSLSGKLDFTKESVQKNIWNHRNTVPQGLVEEMVSFSNPEGEDYTQLEIRLPDSIGLLFRILKIFYQKDMEIRFARIITSADFAYDTFNIKNKHGSRLEEKKEIDELRQEIMMASKENFLEAENVSYKEEIYF